MIDATLTEAYEYHNDQSEDEVRAVVQETGKELWHGGSLVMLLVMGPQISNCKSYRNQGVEQE